MSVLLMDVFVPPLASDAAESIIRRFGLQPLAGEGGWFRRTLESSREAGGRTIGDPRAWSSILALFTSEEFSALHRLAVDEVWTWLAGSPLELTVLRQDGSVMKTSLGPDPDAGQALQHAVRSGDWQGAQVLGPGCWALVSCLCVPEFRQTDFELGRREALIAAYPETESTIRRLTRD